MRPDRPEHPEGQVAAEKLSESTPRRRGVALAGLVFVLLVGHVVWNITVAYPQVPPELRGNDLLQTNLSTVAITLVGGIILWNQPGNRIGWLLLLAGLYAVLMPDLSFDYAGLGLVVAPGSVPAPEVPLWLNQALTQVFFSSLLVGLTALFPDGRLVRPWLRVIWLLLAVRLAVALPGLLDRRILDPYHLHPPLTLPALAGYSQARVPGIIQQVTVAAAFILAWGSMVWRYRESAQDERHQIKWLLAAVFVVFVAFAGSGIAPLLGASRLQNVTPIAATLLPVSIGIAIMRYRLYDIDVVISRTLVYGSLAAFITAVYVGIVVGLGNLVGSGGRPNLALSIVATAIVAVAFQPVRERLQKVANQLVYGKRATPYEVLSQFSERVAESYAADDVLPRMARVLADGTGAARAAVWLRAGDMLRQATSWPVDSEAAEPAHLVDDSLPDMPEADRAFEVRHQGELLGALTVSKRQGESLTPVEEKLLADLASQAGLVLKNVGLTAELLQRLDDLRASRQRLVAAQDEERRRLELNLHDGAQQNLVALKVKLGLAEMMAEKDPARTKELIGELKSDADEALDTLRDLARGIYPPLLADKGLAAALEAQARKATIPVEVLSDGTGRYPQDVEAAVYFCCLEALQNIQKYANAGLATVRLVEARGALSVEIRDDGQGFDPAVVKKGSGLQNIEDRLAAMGGTVAISSSPGAGTTVSGSVPVAAPVAVS